jgi:diguanylate cyclase (GGDEF)-like protein/PAS domain S-box-containing protein
VTVVLALAAVLWIVLRVSSSRHAVVWRRFSESFGLFGLCLASVASIVVARAASQRKRELAKSEDRWRLLVDGTPDCAIFMLDPAGFVSTWNVGAQRIKGYTEAEAVGQHFSIFYTDESRASGHPQAELETANSTGRYEEEAWRVRKDGSMFWANVIITAITDSDGTPRGFSKITRDLTERRIADEARRASEERFRRAFDDAPTAASISDLDGHFVQVNGALSDLVGYTAEGLLTMGGLDLTHPDDRDVDREVFADLVAGRIGSHSRDKRYIHCDGSLVWARIHAVPVMDHDGQITAILNHAIDITQRHRHEEQLIELSTHDPLTGLANRIKFRDELSRHLDRCRRYGLNGAVLMLDLDHFKRVNDSLGHNAGDELIISMATLLRSRMRSADVIARLGGDEFAILLPDGGLQAAEQVASALVEAVRADVTSLDGGRPRTVTVSIGIAVIDDADVSAHELLAAADLAMYDAKDAGRDRYAAYSDDMYAVSKSKAQITWAERVESALEDDSFELWAQPILNLRTNHIESHELLLRMRMPDGDIALPGQFLYIAERVGLIGEIDRWVTTAAIDLLARIQVIHPQHHIEVNVSGLSVGDDGLREHIVKSFAASAADPQGLIFEITETAAVQHIVTARGFANALREIGCRFALDDFGAGFGSFYYLKHLPFDYVKIDGEFVTDCTTNLTDRLVIESVVKIASGLGKETIAEFVGDESTVTFLRSNGVDRAQGYHIGKPIPISEAFPDCFAATPPTAPDDCSTRAPTPSKHQREPVRSGADVNRESRDPRPGRGLRGQRPNPV